MARNRILAYYAFAAIGVLGLATTSFVRASDQVANSSLVCLATNIYHEARGESEAGQRAVAQVTLVRVLNDRWPDTVCEVVWQRKQFSWTHDHLSDEMTDQRSRQIAYDIAYDALRAEPTWDADHYHAANIRPYWAPSLTEVARIGNHIFYKQEL